MNKFHTFVTIGAALLFAAVAIPATAQQPVVVELFTSEGCSSCPPADALLNALSKERNGKGVDLILLAEHVEYWNDLGWRDRFSAAVFTQRQYDYVRQLHLKTAFTPQVVVDGRRQASGGDASALQRMINDAARETKPVHVSLKLAGPALLQIAVDETAGKKLDLWLAITEDNLTTDVKNGENGGRTLRHSAVVRELHAIGKTSGGRFEKTVKLPEKSDWKQGDLRAIVLVQEPNTGPILGAADISLATGGPTTAGR